MSALEGLRVIDAATLAAGPMVATMLGEFGAEVIKIEQPGAGDPLRTWGPRKDGVGLMWKSVGRNKKSATLNLRLARGQELLRQLAKHCDVLIVNYRPSTLAHWGLSYDRLKAQNPGLVMLHITAFGAGGPYSDRPGFGTLGEAMSGFAHITGPADGPPTLPPFMLADGVASLTATSAVMMALYHRDHNGGRGQLIDVDLVEPLARLLEHTVLTYDQCRIVPSRQGNRWDVSVPRNTYRTADGRWLAMSGSSSSAALRVFRAIGRPDLVDDPDYRDARGRLENADDIDKLVADWVALRTLADAMAVFGEHQVAAAPVYDTADLMDDPHLRARGAFVEVPDAELGVMTVQAPPARLSSTPGQVRTLGPDVGAHNDMVFGGLLNLSSHEIADLRAHGVI